MATPETETNPTVEDQTAEEFANRMLAVFNDASLALLLSVGHQVGILEHLATLPPSTSDQVARKSGLDERYVREWLAGATVGGVLGHDPASDTYWLPAEHAASLTKAAGAMNLARMMQIIPLLAGVEAGIVECFRTGGGLGYDQYPRFHQLMAEDSAAVHDAGLLDVVVPVVPSLRERLERGVRVADIGCGSGHAVNILARAFPASSFVGYDLSEEAITAARAEAAELGLANTEFVVRDVAELGVAEDFDVVTAFDAIHDQARPRAVLANVARALRPGGTFLMVDIKASSHVHENLEIPWATFLYTVSLMHCMTVSLSFGGEGLGTAWGRQTAERLLTEAGFTRVTVHDVETDPFNAYYVAVKEP